MEFLSEEDADYAIKIMNMIKLYGKPIRVNKASAHNKNLDVGANIFIGNLDSEIDEKLLYDTFSAFGVILQTPKIMRDPDTGNSKGYAFINFASFDASDAAIEAMNGQYLCNRPITVSYAFKKDSKGERHGSAAERLLAAQNPLSQADRPHQLFADAPPPQAVPPPVLTSMGHAGMGMPGGMPPPGVFSHMPPPGAMQGMPPGMAMHHNHQAQPGGHPAGPPPFPPGSMHGGVCFRGDAIVACSGSLSSSLSLTLPNGLPVSVLPSIFVSPYLSTSLSVPLKVFICCEKRNLL